MSHYIEKIPDDAVKINKAFDYIDKNGNVYGIEKRHNHPRSGFPFIKAQSTTHGYKYCGVSYEDGRRVNKRVHRLVAEAFIPNPNHFPIVTHKDNDKKNNCVENLKWGTIQENTKQAHTDGLLVNDKAWNDSQSIPVDQYDTATNKLIAEYGSVSDASNKTGIEKSTILFQCKSESAKIRKKTYFVFHNTGARHHDIVVAHDFETDCDIGRFANTRIAAEYFGVDNRTVSDHIIHGKPKWAKVNVWFERITI